MQGAVTFEYGECVAQQIDRIYAAIVAYCSRGTEHKVARPARGKIGDVIPRLDIECLEDFHGMEQRVPG